MTMQNSEKNNEKDWRQAESNGFKLKSKEICGVFKGTMSITFGSSTKERHINFECTKTNPNSLSKESNGEDWRKSPDYEDKQNWRRDRKEVSNWQINGQTRDNDSKHWTNNNNHGSSQTSSPQRRRDRKNLVFDKRDFLFPDTPKETRKQIQLDEVALYSVTDTHTADEISDFIAKLSGLNQGNIVITDGTACVGGNTISFCKKFTRVQAVEVDPIRYDMLTHNLKLLRCYNVKCYHENYVNLLQKLTQDIVFLDPPWGGPSYKEKEEVELFLGNVPLDEVCEKLKPKTKYIIIKAPTNLNYEKFKAKISGNSQVFYNFRKMLLIVIDYHHPPDVVQRKEITNDSNTNKNQSTDKEANKSYNIDIKSRKTANKSSYDADADDAALYAAKCYGDYVIEDDYVYEQAYRAARAVVRDGINAARNAAVAAYQRATDDMKYARNYEDSDIANVYRHVASDHDYYFNNNADNANGTDVTGTHGADGVHSVSVSNTAYGIDSTAGVNADVGANGFDSTDVTNDVDSVDNVGRTNDDDGFDSASVTNGDDGFDSASITNDDDDIVSTIEANSAADGTESTNRFNGTKDSNVTKIAGAVHNALNMHLEDASNASIDKDDF